MKKTYLYTGVAVLLIVGFVLYRSLKAPESAAQAHAETEAAEAHEESAEHKEVALNEAQYQAAGIQLGTFAMKNLSEVINTNGYTKLPPQNQADVSVLVPGIVKSIKAIEGQYVRKGQTLATIESMEFTRLQEAYLTSRSNMELLGSEFERQKLLDNENINSKKTLQRAKSEYEIEKARFASLKKQLNMLNLNGGGNIVSSVSVSAPISGYITEVYVKIGTNAESGKPLFSIVDNSKMHVDLLVYEKDLQKVKVGQAVHFILTNQDNTEITGKIFSIGKAFENETKSIAVHADILNDKQMLIPGMYVNALIDVGKNAVRALPVEAVIKADGREFIFVLEEATTEKPHDAQEDHAHDDGHEHREGPEKKYHFQRVEVKTGTVQLGFVQVNVLQEIDQNAQIVLKGAYYIQSHLLKSEGGGGHAH